MLHSIQLLTVNTLGKLLTVIIFWEGYELKNKKEVEVVRICFLSFQLKGIPLTDQRVFAYQP